jgi:hypothetical protein
MVTESYIEGAYGSGERRCAGEASNWAVPHSMNGTSIALYILFSFSFRLSCLEILFCGLAVSHSQQQRTFWKGIEELSINYDSI